MPQLVEDEVEALELLSQGISVETNNFAISWRIMDKLYNDHRAEQVMDNGMVLERWQPVPFKWSSHYEEREGHTWFIFNSIVAVEEDEAAATAIA